MVFLLSFSFGCSSVKARNLAIFAQEKDRDELSFFLWEAQTSRDMKSSEITTLKRKSYYTGLNRGFWAWILEEQMLLFTFSPHGNLHCDAPTK